MEIKSKYFIFTLILLFNIKSFSQEIYPASIVYFDPNNKIMDASFERNHNYKFIIDSNYVPNLLSIELEKDIVKTDLKVLIYPGLNAIKFTNGSIIAAHETSFDYNQYAEEHNLDIARVFGDLNIIVFKTTNFKNLKLIVKKLKNEDGVKLAKIDFIDPSIIPQ